MIATCNLTHPTLALLDNVIEQFLACVLHDHDHIGRRGNDLVPSASASRLQRACRADQRQAAIPHQCFAHSQLDDMRMPQNFQILNLTLHTCIHIRRGDLGAIDELERDLVAGDSMGSHCACQLGLLSLRPLISRRASRHNFPHRTPDIADGCTAPGGVLSLPSHTCTPETSTPTFNSHLTFPKLPVPNVRSMIYCPILFF